MRARLDDIDATCRPHDRQSRNRYPLARRRVVLVAMAVIKFTVGEDLAAPS